MVQPFEDSDEIYNNHLKAVLDFFVSRLQPYYSSSRLTLVLTFLSTTQSNHFPTHCVPLPSRLKIMDSNALNLHGIHGFVPQEHLGQHRKIFQDFLNSGDPLALDEKRYATAASACLKILFGLYRPLVSKFRWFTQHSRILRVGTEPPFQRHYADLPARTNWRRNIEFYWCFRTFFPGLALQGVAETPQSTKITMDEFRVNQIRILSSHLQFLLEKSVHSDNILSLARRKVFRFGYLHRNHPTYMKKAIFSLARYIRRVTGEGVEVRACESVWGRDAWFTAN